VKYDNITYCIDANILIVFHRYYPIELFPDLWTKLDELFQKKLIFSHEIVFNEICHDKKKPDALAKWLLPKRTNFIDTSDFQIQQLPDILKNFPKLIDPNQEKEQADPWLIAMLIELKNNLEMFSSDTKYILVSNENKNSTIKLPAACKYYGIDCINMFEFFQENDWKFSVT
jgi:hypothetical protein